VLTNDGWMYERLFRHGSAAAGPPLLLKKAALATQALNNPGPAGSPLTPKSAYFFHV